MHDFPEQIGDYRQREKPNSMSRTAQGLLLRADL